MKAFFQKDPLGVATLLLAICAIGAAALASRGPGTAAPDRPRTLPAGSAELSRCRNLGEAGGADPACHAAWAESRRRFFGTGERP